MLKDRDLSKKLIRKTKCPQYESVRWTQALLLNVLVVETVHVRAYRVSDR